MIRVFSVCRCHKAPFIRAETNDVSMRKKMTISHSMNLYIGTFTQETIVFTLNVGINKLLSVIGIYESG